MRSEPLTEYREHHRSSDESRKTSNVLRVSKTGGDKRRSRDVSPHLLSEQVVCRLPSTGADYDDEKRTSERAVRGEISKPEQEAETQRGGGKRR